MDEGPSQMTIAVIIPVFNSSQLLSETLLAVLSGTRVPDELIVIDDRSDDDSAHTAERFGARVVRMPQNVGPAACRNYAALLAQSEILVFLDCDTCVHVDTIERMEGHLAADASLTAVIGSYDDTPRHPGICSQYRNLAHCYVHRSANRKALTFWSGCGAVRRAWFFEVDGFDERYRKPSIEDIELGYRMSDRGARILLDPEICVTHTKRWTVSSSIATDILNRGVPWMVLLLERRKMPDDLNLRRRHRVATVLTGAALVCLAACVRSALWFVPSFLLATLALCMDAGLLEFIYRKRGFRSLIVAASMTLVQNLSKLVATGGGLLLFAFRSFPSLRMRRGERRSQILDCRQALEEESLRLSKLPSTMYG
jgi:glycosyltransferase involved in cell wall biosynthesis